MQRHQMLLFRIAQGSRQKNRFIIRAEGVGNVNSQSRIRVLAHGVVQQDEPIHGLLRQMFALQPLTSVERALSDTSSRLGDRITITRFVRWDADPSTEPRRPAVAMALKRLREIQ
jgi:hypothetical protein